MAWYDFLNPLGSIYDIYQGERDYRLQKDNLAYQKNLQQQIFNREDSAIQRRVADLEKAGLSPTLAAGQGAQAGNVIGTQAPQSKYSAQEKAFMIQQGLKQQADITKTREEAKAIYWQAEKAKVEADLLNEQRGKATLEQNLLGMQYSGLADEIAHRQIGRDLQIAQAESARAGTSRTNIEIEKLGKELEVLAYNMGVAKEHGLPYGQSLGSGFPFSLGALQSVKTKGKSIIDLGWNLTYGEDAVSTMKNVWYDLKEQGMFGFSRALAESAWQKISSTMTKAKDKIKAAPGKFLESFNKLIERGKGDWESFSKALAEWQSQWR